MDYVTQRNITRNQKRHKQHEMVRHVVHAMDCAPPCDRVVPLTPDHVHCSPRGSLLECGKEVIDDVDGALLHVYHDSNVMRMGHQRNVE